MQFTYLYSTLLCLIMFLDSIFSIDVGDFISRWLASPVLLSQQWRHRRSLVSDWLTSTAGEACYHSCNRVREWRASGRGLTLTGTGGGGWCNPPGFPRITREWIGRSSRNLVYPNHWTILHLPWKFQVRTYYDLWPVTWFPGSCQAKFAFRTVSMPETCEHRYVCWWYGHG